MTAKEIDKRLRQNYTNSKYLVSNVYCFHEFYKETDFLIINNNGHAFDIEIKISMQDFKKDVDKVHKHNILSNSHFQLPYKYSGKYEANELIYTEDRPNRFYYCIPQTLQSKIQPLIPEYAGLLVITESGKMKKIKEAKLLHKNNQMQKLESRLCRKFYYNYLESRQH